MSGIRLAFGDERITRHLLALQVLHATSFDRARREIGEYLVGEVQDAFDEQHLADGNPMPQSKAAQARDGKTLIDHHHLYDSYVWQATAQGLEVGSALVYAAIHHFGGETGRRGHRFTLPARPVLGVTDRQSAVIGQYLLDAIERAPS